MKKSLIAILLASLALTACSSGPDEVTARDESKVSASADLRIRDAVTGDGIDSVLVSFVVNGKRATRLTDSLGRFSVGGLPAGTYLFSFSRAGYAGFSLTAPLAVDGNEQVIVIPDFDGDLTMAALGVSVTGQVKMTTPAGNNTLVEGAIVDLVLGGFGWEIPQYTATTNASGAFTFSDLPEGVAYTLSVRNMSDAGLVYGTGTTWGIGASYVGETIAQINPFVLAVQAPNLGIDQTNLINGLSLAADADVVLTFSDAIDTTRIMRNDILVSDPAGETVAATVAWSAGGTVLTISPVGGAWSSAGTHSVDLDLYSNAGDRLIDTQNFSILLTGTISAVAGFKVDSVDNVAGDGLYAPKTATGTVDIGTDVDLIDLSWTAKTEAQVLGYEVYVQGPGDAHYWLYSTLAGFDNNTLTLNLGFGGLSQLDNNETLLIKVVGYNDAGSGSVTAATAITLKGLTTCDAAAAACRP